jgi:PAS domain S-box-containing protein
MSLVFAAIVSEHKQTEKKLRETERLKWEEFYMLLERLPAGAYTCDKSGLITYFNEQAVKIWGREPKLNNPVDMYCGSFKLYINNDPIKHEECWMARAIMDNKEYNGEEILIERPDGSTIEVLAHANPIRNKTGELVGAVNVLVDVSEMKKVQVALSEAYGKMEERVQERTAELRKTQAELIHSEKLASLGRFSAGIAHEIRNPLANISSLAQLLLKKNSNAEINQHLNYILANSDIANRIIKDLLNIASQDNTSSSKIDLSVLLANICNSAEARCNKSKIVINKEIDFNIPGVKGNEDKLYAAFMNFISNAIDSMPNGGNLIVTAKFDAPKADSPSGEVVITFEDEGVGIPEENLTKVLEPFFTTKNEGTGLGLTLAYNVIRAHNGKIEIESEKDIGTKFTIRLPVNQS